MIRKSDLIVFSGTHNAPLAEKVAKYLKMPLGQIDIRHFPDGETFCQIKESVRGKDVFFIQSGNPRPNDALMEMFIMMDAARRGSAASPAAGIACGGAARG